MTQRKSIILNSGFFEELNTPTDKLDFAGNSTTDLIEGTNLYYLDSRARGSISVTDNGGDGSLAYNSTSGVITYTGPSAADVRAHFSVAAGSGLTYNSGTGVFGTNAIPNGQLANSSVTLGGTTVNLGDTKASLLGFTQLQATTLNSGPSGSANNIALSAGSITFEGATASNGFTTALTVTDPTAVRTITFPDATGDVALLQSLSATNTGAGYGSLSYSSATGVFNFAVVTDANIRGSISVTDSGGDGSLSYNSGTGVITYVGPSATEVRTHFSAATATGITYNSGTGQFSLGSIPNLSLTHSSITVGTTAIALGGSSTTLTGLTSVTTTALTVNDQIGGLAIRDADDATKIARFDSGTIATGTTRTYTFPNESGTLLTSASTIPGGTFVDSTFRISDDSDDTKKLAFQCSGITTGTVRTMTVPDSSGVISTEDFATAVAIALG
jgi:hypothetical protein